MTPGVHDPMDPMLSAPRATSGRTGGRRFDCLCNSRLARATRDATPTARAGAARPHRGREYQRTDRGLKHGQHRKEICDRIRLAPEEGHRVGEVAARRATTRLATRFGNPVSGFGWEWAWNMCTRWWRRRTRSVVRLGRSRSGSAPRCRFGSLRCAVPWHRPNTATRAG